MTALPLLTGIDSQHEDASSFHVSWAAVDTGLWSGSSEGSFVGIVERLARGRYRAVNGVGEQIAVCGTLAEAKARLLHPSSLRASRHLRLLEGDTRS